MWPAAVRMMDALRKWPRGSEPNETGFCLANNTTESLYEVIGRSPERAARFANAVKVFATRPEYDPIHIMNNFDWASLGQALVLDVGGA
ncbi:hypothetical protein F5Y09DRAFT_343758 [Xylaria sp. FL1042]|nr:hypothetical protein F5Y09DRAFT_343758 [Xylaria sp. FL1042]